MKVRELKSTQSGSDASILRWGLAAIVSVIAAPSAFGQTAAPNQTPPGESAIEPSPQTQFAFPPAQGLTAPEGAEEIEVTLADISVDGQYPELEQVSDALKQERIGRQVTVADVYGFAADLQQAYFEAGYPLARVVVPPQQLDQQGVVRILVVDGFVSRADVSQLPERVRSQVNALLSPLVGARRPTRAKIERAVLLAGDVAGLKLRSALTPGDEVGATVLVLSGEHDSVAAAISVDNRVGEELGRWQTTASVVLNSYFGHGEQLYAVAAVPADEDAFRSDSRRNYLGFGVQTPIGTDGASVGASLDYSTTHPRGDVAQQKLESEYARVGVNLSYPFVRSRTLNVRGRAAFDLISDVESTRFTGERVTLSADRTRVARLSVEAENEFAGGARAAASATLSHGLDVFGARQQSDASALKPISRSGAQSNFSTLEIGLNAVVPFGEDWQAAASARAQVSFNEPVVRSEQFSPSGASTGISGPPPGAMTGDAGSVGRVEFTRPVRLNLPQAGYVAPYVFAEAATTTLEKPSALESARSEIAGAGLGVRFGLGQTPFGYSWTGSVEFANTNSDQDGLDREWVTAALSFRF